MPDILILPASNADDDLTDAIVLNDVTLPATNLDAATLGLSTGVSYVARIIGEKETFTVSVTVTATGAVSIPAASVSGAGVREITSTGAMTSPAATAGGTGTVTEILQLTAADLQAQVTGTGNVPLALTGDDGTYSWILTPDDPALDEPFDASDLANVIAGNKLDGTPAPASGSNAVTSGTPVNITLPSGLSGNYYAVVADVDSIVFDATPQAIDTTSATLSSVSFTTGTGAAEVDWAFTPNEDSATVTGYRVAFWADGSTPSDAERESGTGAVTSFIGTASASVAEGGTYSTDLSAGVTYVPTIFYEDQFGNKTFETYADVTAGSGGGAWTPADLGAKLEGWWEMNDAANLFTDSIGGTNPTDGQGVLWVEDLSGNAHHVQNIDVVADASWDATNTALDIASGLRLHVTTTMSLGTACEVYVLVQTTDTFWTLVGVNGDVNSYLGLSQAGSTSTTSGNAGTPTYQVDSGADLTDTRGALNAAWATGAWVVASARNADLTSGNWQSELNWLSYSSGGGVPFIGKVRAIILTNAALTAGERSDLDTYLDGLK